MKENPLVLPLFLSLFLLLMLAVCWTSCEKNIAFTGEITDPVLVMNGFLTPDSAVSVQLSQSRFILGEAMEEAPPLVKNAIVSLYVNDEFKENLPHIAEGVYRGSYFPKADEVIRVEAKADGFHDIRGETVIPRKPHVVTVDSLSSEEVTVTSVDNSGYAFQYINWNARLRLKMTEHAGEENYYFLIGRKFLYLDNGTTLPEYLDLDVYDLLKSIDPDYTNFLEDELFGGYSSMVENLFSDRFVDGKELSFDFSFHDRIDSRVYLNGEEVDDPKREAEIELQVRIACMSKGMYQHIVSGSKALEVDGNFLAEPVQVYSNIENGVGILASYTTHTVIFRYKKRYDANAEDPRYPYLTNETDIRTPLTQEGQKITVSGFIYDRASHESLIAANVYDLVSGQGAVSNNFGFYSLSVPPGETVLRPSYVGYLSEEHSFAATQDTVVHFFLQPSSLLKEVVVEGELKNPLQRAETGKITFDAATLKTVPALMGESDVIKALQQMPGVAVGTDGMAGLYVRGGNADENLFLVDGNPLYHVHHLLGLFSTFNPEAVKTMDFYKGSFPARYGGRLSSVMDVRMNDGDIKNSPPGFRLRKRDYTRSRQLRAQDRDERHPFSRFTDRDKRDQELFIRRYCIEERLVGQRFVDPFHQWRGTGNDAESTGRYLAQSSLQPLRIYCPGKRVPLHRLSQGGGASACGSICGRAANRLGGNHMEGRKHFNSALFSNKLFRDNRYTLDFSITDFHYIYHTVEEYEDEFGWGIINERPVTLVLNSPIEILFTALSPELYPYFRSGDYDPSGDEASFKVISEPEITYSNVHNGIGVVGAVSTAKARIELPPLPEKEHPTP